MMSTKLYLIQSNYNSTATANLIIVSLSYWTDFFQLSIDIQITLILNTFYVCQNQQPTNYYIREDV
jgi:hypothetical protein